MPHRIAHAKDFCRLKSDFGDIGNICERARCNVSWLESQIILLVREKLGFQTLVMVEKKIEF